MVPSFCLERPTSAAYRVFVGFVGSALVLVATSCTFQSELGQANCSASQEGEQRNGRVCRGGYWVNVDVQSSEPDAGDASDTTEPDTTPDVCLPSSEECNGVDDDCDGRIDDGIDCSCNYNGEDRGVCADARVDESGECQRPGDYNESEVRCSDGKDNDCDGAIDDTDSDCQCTGDGTRNCYTGPAATEGVGICAAGEQSCVNGRWGPCEMETTPDSGEICGDGLDNDCDGTIDNGCECAYDPMESDQIDTDGSHEAGVCAGQSIDDTGVCTKPADFESRTNTESSCDDLDNDCDGATDEGCDCTFDPFESNRNDTDGSHDAGVCTGQMRRSDGLCGAPASFETKSDSEDGCDNADNDCDGVTDEGCPCDYQSTSEGVCGDASRDAQGSCSAPAAFDSTDDEYAAGLCDQLDNDCDGATDEGCPCDYTGTSEGVCAAANRDATGTCAEPNQYDSTDDESSVGNCDSLDNDCDGITDEGCPCNYRDNASGVCGTATRDMSGTCTAPSGYDSTDDESSAGLCGGLDNDCDGATDEGCPCHYNGRTEGVCGTATRDSSGTCVQPSGYESPTDTESSCSSDDNDCDGVTDEGCPCNFGGDSDGVCGSATIDTTGTCAQPSNYESATDAESYCDGADNDCDGVTDEGCPCDYTGTSEGVCGTATSDAQGNCQEPSDYDSTDDESSAGLCDQVDNDCDGYTDEGCSCDYTGTPEGICSTATRDSTGSCQQPTDYEAPETSLCSDGVDNDCDGTTDEATKGGGTSCTNNCECYSGRCASGTCAYRVFVTSSELAPDFGGLSGADTKCNDVASNAGLSGTWKAVLSDSSTDASARISIDAPVVELDGNEVAGGASDFWSDSHSDDIDTDESGSQTSVCSDGCDDDHVWTGTTTSGAGQGNYCVDWSSISSGDSAGTGDAGRTNSEWVEEMTEPCDKTLHVYCVDGQ